MMKYSSTRATLIFSGLLISFMHSFAQCDDGQISLSMNIYTDGWGYETYWEIVPGTNACGDGTIIWGSNLEAVGCNGGGEANSYGTETAYPSNTVVPVNNICLNEGELYTLYFVDDWGDGGLYFEMFQDGSLTGVYAGTGIGNAWTFEAGFNPLGPFDSPCNAALLQPGLSSAIELNNTNCYTQVNEIHPFLGHCSASGAWCADDVTKTLWAQFTVPDEGSYEISTVHNGTYINTQMAVYVAEDCSNPESFILVAANDNFWGESNLPECGVDIPECVNRASAAFDNVISELPQCCSDVWSQECQDLYETMSESCADGTETCTFLLEGFDSYGDGWNDCYITVTINGDSEDYTFYEGNYQSWELNITSGDQVTITFTPASWPEEVTVALRHPDGNYLLNVQPFEQDPVIFNQTLDCSGDVFCHPEASRCFVNCLPAGITCYVQIDGFQNASGDFVLTVKPYNEQPQILAETTDLICPTGAGSVPVGQIITYIEGWGLNYTPEWESDNGFSSSEYHLVEIFDGTYHLSASDACGNSLEAEYVVSGPEPFLFSSMSEPTCIELSSGSVSTQFTGGTAPYSFYWLLPDSSIVESTELSGLNAGIYQFHLTDDAGCAIIDVVEVGLLPVPEFSLGEDFTVCDEFMVQVEGPLNMVDYEWSVGQQTQNIILSDEDFGQGAYNISLEVFNAFGCSYTDSLTFTVVPCTGIEAIRVESLLLFPQPAGDFLNIAGLPQQDILLEIRDVCGRVVSSLRTAGQSQLSLATDQFTSGIYLLSAANLAGISTFQFTITH